MKKTKSIGVVKYTQDGNAYISELVTGNDITSLFRSIMVQHAIANDEALIFDHETGRARRAALDQINQEELKATYGADPQPQTKQEADPVLALIKKCT